MARMSEGASDYARIERAIHYLHAHLRDQPGLAEAAAAAGLSEFHFQRLFQRWAGISPKRFLQVLTLAEAKRSLDESRSLLDASLDLGLSGPSRLHDLFLGIERMTPGEYKARARGITLRFGIEGTPFGEALFAATDRGLAALTFLDEGGEERARQDLAARWPGATLVHDPAAVRPHADTLRARLTGEPGAPIGLVLKGTPLQLKVWEALLRIPPGSVLSYGHLARLAGAPRAARAVGSAVGQNPIAVLVPCHRVIQSTGVFGDYRWDPARKMALLGVERARAAG